MRDKWSVQIYRLGFAIGRYQKKWVLELKIYICFKKHFEVKGKRPKHQENNNKIKKNNVARMWK